MLSWFMIHYKTEKKLNISGPKLFDEEEKVMTAQEFFGAD